MEKYFFKVVNGQCMKECPIKKTSSGFIRQIGSMACQGCENCIESDQSEYPLWIKCKYVSKRSYKKNILRIAAVLAYLFIVVLFSTASMFSTFFNLFSSAFFWGAIAVLLTKYIWNLSNKN
jgi:hypothetical protein